MHPNIPGLIRVPVFITILVFAIIVLGLDADFVKKASSETVDFLGIQFSVSSSAPTFAKLGVAVAVITIVSIGPMLVIDLFRRGAPTSFIVVELGWLAVLWVLWLATAAEIASKGPCNVSGCSQFQAAEAFSFLTWLLLMAYWGLLLGFTLLAAIHQQTDLWFTSVSDADFTARGAPPSGGAYPTVPGEPQMAAAATGTTGATYPPSNV